MPKEEAIEAAVEALDQRNLWRRKEDVRRNMIIITLSAVLVAGGIAWGTAQAAVSSKADRSEVEKHFLADSLRNLSRDDRLVRIEAKVDSTNARLIKYICHSQPDYCR